MRLEKLEIKGFKSFRDKTVLEFPDPFTVIVGPNGSGKSNLIDAVCFVLGKSRGLRANTIQELLCNGGVEHKGCDSAIVAMHLSGGDKKVKVSRELDKTGKSTYRIDDKVASRQGILDIIGDSEYNILLQGDVNKVIDMKPRERRRIIDDLCGIGEYDKKKEKALDELSKVEQKISDVHIVIGEKQGYLEELGKEKDEAVKYQGLQDELRKSKATVLGLHVEEHEKKEEKLKERIAALQSSREQAAARLAEIKKALSEKNQELKKVNAEILSLEEKRGGTRIVELRGEIGRCKDRIETLNAGISAADSKAGEKKKRREELEAEEKKLSEELKKVAAELKELDRKVEEESKKVAAFKFDSDIDLLKTEIYDIKSKISSTTEIGLRDARELESLEKERGELEAKMKESLTREKELARGIDETMIASKSDFDEYDRLKSELPELEKKYKEISKEYEKAQIEYASKNSEMKTLERTTDNLSSSVAAVMNLKTIIPGIHGIVSQLGSVSNPEYEKALHIAAGGRLQNVVVEDEDVAAKCIDYLKKKKVGRATFLPISKINVRVADKIPKGAIGFARNLITTPRKFEKIFDYIYGDTLIVKDIDAAKKIGIGSWRMVSLDGDLITREGAMTGGYLKERDVSIKFSSTDEIAEELKELEKTIIKLDGERQMVEQKKRKVEEKIEKIEGSVSTGKTEVEKIRLEKTALSEKREEIKKREAELSERIASLKKKASEEKVLLKKFADEESSKEKKLAKMMEKTPKIDRTSLDEVKEKKHAADIEKSRLEEKLNGIASQVKETDSELKKLKEESSALDAELKKTKESAKKLEEEVALFEKENAKLMKDIEALIGNRNLLEKEMTDASAESGKLEFESSRMQEDLSKNEIEKAKVETRLEELRREFTAYAGVEVIADAKLKDLEARIRDIEGELSVFGSVNMRAIESFETLKKELEEVAGKLDTLKNERQSIFDFMETVERRKRETFTEAFEKVKANFERIFADISDGEGTLILDNPRDISDSGLLITASPKGKKLMNMDLMSGGEKVLTTSAFLLSIQQYKPSHFYILDELDAALDKENSGRLAELLARSEAQFILVTHNENMMKNAKSVIGVSMVNGISQIVGVKLNN